MRTLYHVSVFHTKEECLLTEKRIKKIRDWKYIEKNMEEKWNAIEKFWDGVDAVFEKLQLPRDRVSIFQDSHFQSAKEWSICLGTPPHYVKEGARTLQLVLRLIEQGAQLERTESRLIWKSDLFFTDFPLSIWGIRERMRNLFFLLRDRYIAHRINHALKDEKIGVLLLGAGHKEFLRHLDSDIVVQTLCADLIEEARKSMERSQQRWEEELPRHIEEEIKRERSRKQRDKQVTGGHP